MDINDYVENEKVLAQDLNGGDVIASYGNAIDLLCDEEDIAFGEVEYAVPFGNGAKMMHVEIKGVDLISIPFGEMVQTYLPKP